MDQDVDLALREREELITQGYWVRLDIQFEPVKSIVAVFGRHTFDGRREIEIAMRRYYMQEVAGFEYPTFVQHIHS